MIKPTPTEQEVLLASEALRLMDEQNLEMSGACDQAVFGQGDKHQYTDEGGKLYPPVLRKMREIIRERRMVARRATFSFFRPTTIRRG